MYLSDDKILFMKPKDISGQKFGRLTAIKQLPNDKLNVMWECVCDCGSVIKTRGTALRSGWTQSCGCYRVDQLNKKLAKHSMCKTPEHTAWTSMKCRCYAPKTVRYKDYGGRGITVCDRWRDSFNNFFEDMGKRPSPIHSLDRIDVNGNYEPTNCRWATQIEQSSNTRRNVFITHNGKTDTLSGWARTLGISSNIFYPNYKKYGDQVIIYYANRNKE